MNGLDLIEKADILKIINNNANFYLYIYRTLNNKSDEIVKNKIFVNLINIFSDKYF